jgi:Domain of unknown function (DUF4342)
MSADRDTKSARQEAVRLRGQAFVDKVKELIHEGNVRRVVIKNDEGRTIIEIPVTAGVVVAVVAPVLTAIGAIAALASEWTIEVERSEPPSNEVVIDQEPGEAPAPDA